MNRADRCEPVEHIQDGRGDFADRPLRRTALGGIRFGLSGLFGVEYCGQLVHIQLFFPLGNNNGCHAIANQVG